MFIPDPFFLYLGNGDSEYSSDTPMQENFNLVKQDLSQ